MNEQTKIVTLRDDPSSASGESFALAPAFALTPMAMLSQAVAKGASMDILEKLMALAERWEANQARKAFDAAISGAKAEIPPIFKNRVVDFTSSKGRTHYRHEDLAEIARTVDPILANHNLSYRFRTGVEQGVVTVTCIVSHREGHSEQNTLSAGKDDSGNKNHIQAIGSAVSYLQRYTLKASLGLAATEDDDGREAGNSTNGLITEEQVAQLQEMLVHTASNVPRFLEFMKVERLQDIRVADFKRAWGMLKAKEAKS